MVDVALAGRGPALWQPRRILFWAILIPVGYAAFYHLPFVVFPAAGWTVAAPVAWLPANLIMATLIGWVILRLDPFEKEPASLLWGCAVWGGTAATLAVIPNRAFLELLLAVGGTDLSEKWGPAIAGPLTEEWLKGIGILLIMLLCRSHLQRTLDGFILGAATGLGFQVVENLSYAYTSALNDPNSDWTGAIAVSLSRVLVGATSHWVYSALVGYGLGYAITQVQLPWRRRIGVAGLGALGGWAVHFIWNSPWLADLGLLSLIPKMIIVGLFVWLMYRVPARREFAWFRDQLAGEPARSITAAELEDLRTLGNRRRARRLVRGLAGGAGERGIQTLHQAQIDLAVALGNLDNPDRDRDVRRARLLITEARAELDRIVPPGHNVP